MGCARVLILAGLLTALNTLPVLAQVLPDQQALELHPLLVLLVGTTIIALCVAIGVWVARR